MILRILKINVIVLLLFSGSNALAEDLNCLLCHRHFGLNTIDKDGSLRIYFINETLYSRSAHGNIDCIDCHAGINKIPHENTKPVNCTVECHVKEPTQRRKFSHKPIVNIIRKSAHSPLQKSGKKKKHPKDYPSCTNCHEQPIFRAFTSDGGDKEPFSKKSLRRCKACHERGDFAETYLRHVATRLQKQRNPNERIEMCASCHSSKALLERHKMDDAVSSYKETFHSKLVSLGSEKAPDCIDCHVWGGTNGHLIQSAKNKKAPTHPDNVGKTCQQAACHEKADEKLAGFQTHVTYSQEKYPIQFYILMFFRVIMSGTMFGFLALVFLELLRRLFPNFQLLRKKKL